MPHLFMATLSTETNTFSPLPTGMGAYEAFFLRHGDATAEPPNLMTEALHVWRARSEALGWSVTESLSAVAEPAGRTTAAAHAALKGEILADLDAAGAPEVILLQLHGAMVADGCDDCEGDLVAAIRARRPEAVIGVALDLHCHLTDALLEAADLVICFKEYPHDDATPRAEELFDLGRRTLAGEVSPRMVAVDLPMIGLFLTKTQPMRGLVDAMVAAEDAQGILSVSFAHGFPFADLPETGARMLVVADGDSEAAHVLAERLAADVYAARAALAPSYPDLPTALDRAARAPNRPVVLADMSDNSGAGAPGDATHVLREVLARGLPRVAAGLFWDPQAVGFCREAGEGAEIALRLGGKAEPASGQPLDVTGRVTRISFGLGQHLGGGLEPLGTLVRLTLPGEVDLLVNDLRTQVYHPEAFTQMGIDLGGKDLIVVKSLFHFYAPFAAIAPEVILCASPGRVNPDTRRLEFTRRDNRFWPRVADPLGMGAPSSTAKREVA